VIEERAGRPLVRPRFLKVSLVVLVMLLAIAAHAAWDYAEMRRLRSTIDAIERAGEPVTGQAVQQFPDLAAGAADRDYRAASVLIVGFGQDASLSRIQAAALRDRSWPPDVVEAMSAEVHRYEEALSFVDRAARLPYEGIEPGTEFIRLWGNLFTAARACGWRAITLALSGRGDEAVESLYSAARLMRPLGRSFNAATVLPTSDLEVTLEHTRPSTKALARLADALNEWDGDDLLRRRLLRIRGGVIDAAVAVSQNREEAIFTQDVRYNNAKGMSLVTVLGPPGPRAWLRVFGRPGHLYAIRGLIASFDPLLSAATLPWPRRIERVTTLSEATLWPRMLGGIAAGAGTELARIRSMKTAVAIERYMRDHAETLPDSIDRLVPAYLASTPIDPFTGRPVVLRAEAGGYSVYSVGTNGKDDGGDFKRTFTRERNWETADVGMRVRR